MACGDDLKTLLSRHVDGELSPDERGRVEEHLVACSDCREMLELFRKNESILSNAKFHAILERFSVDAALIAWPELNPRRWQFPREDWALVYRGDDAWIYAKRVPRHAALIAAHELPKE